MTAAVLALASGLLLGLLSVTTRVGIRQAPSIGAAGLVLNGTSFLVAAVVAGVRGLSAEDFALSGLWPFLLMGVFIPGFTQIAWLWAVDKAGPSRTQTVIATSPLVAALLAVGLLSEPWNAALIGGTILVVAGGMALVWERRRPVDFSLVGVAIALTLAMMLGMRDTGVRWALPDATTNSALGAAATLLTATITVVVLASVLPRWRYSLAEFLPTAAVMAVPGVLMGAHYVLFFEAFARGRVTLVAPLLGTHALWSVVIAAVVLRGAEVVTRRLVLATTLIVGGAALVTAFRS